MKPNRIQTSTGLVPARTRRSRPAPLAVQPGPRPVPARIAGPSRPARALRKGTLRPRPAMALLEPAPRCPVELGPLLEDCARLATLRGAAFARDAIRLPGDPAARPSALNRVAAAAAVLVAAMPFTVPAILESVLSGLRLG